MKHLKSVATAVLFHAACAGPVFAVGSVDVQTNSGSAIISGDDEANVVKISAAGA